MTQRIKRAAVILLAACLAGPAFAQSSGTDIYRTKCAMCHGTDGLASTPTAKNFKVLSFKDPVMVKASDAEFLATTINGKGKMPGYKGKLTNEQIKDVLAYVRTLQK